MTNAEQHPEPIDCPAAVASGPCLQFWPAREVPLGGVRGVSVSRTLPQRGLPTVGAWCFLDSFGPAEPDMSVLPHPHIGLQTVTWPLSGVIRHRDSLGSDVLVRPGELNIMTAGNGIAHSEFSWLQEPGGEDQTMRGLQLWVALPEGSRHGAASFEQHKDLPSFTSGVLSVRVILGELSGHRSAATTFSPLVGAEITVDADGEGKLALNHDFEHAILVLDGALQLDDQEVLPGPLAFLGAGRHELNLSALAGTRFLLIGGEPFEEELLMWWNFVGRSQEEIESARADWEAQSPRFPTVPGHGPEAGIEAGRIPAPELPTVRMSPRKRASAPPATDD
ncbi:pirin family protein [Psychromicrobium lacuslunae]|uniref:Pirin n=1 Tax=Psychromicrobium lacuslunae TaxID=1618207 RepID=A0A0D4BZN1_9MICC|nr:pirin family protein [Psychromicrobium lacuslunae]AJT41595.1 pirin [Psychromicrobium lacuslunae]